MITDMCCKVDPLKKFTKFEDYQLLASCGLLSHVIHLDYESNLYQQAIDMYPFYSGDMDSSKGGYTEDYEITYPGDPDLPPILQYERTIDGEKEVLCVYQYGIVAWFFKEQFRHTRMD